MKKIVLPLIALFGLIFAATMLPGCKASPIINVSPGKTAMNLSVFYRERILLPSGSTLTVRLEDVSKMDVAATVIVEKTIELETAPPYNITLEYDAGAIKKNMRYGIRARIEHHNSLLFINTSAIDPFAAEAGDPIEVLVESANQ